MPTIRLLQNQKRLSQTQSSHRQHNKQLLPPVNMESHMFSDPRPVRNGNNDNNSDSTPNVPTWTVDVIRIAGHVVVDTLLVNTHTLPPRKGKNKKIVWELPDSVEDAQPKFGQHEKKRLWEMFKQQKKERRKNLKHKNAPTKDSEKNNRTATDATATTPNSHKKDAPVESGDDVVLKQVESQNETAGLPLPPQQSATPATPVAVAPPPGLEMQQNPPPPSPPCPPPGFFSAPPPLPPLLVFPPPPLSGTASEDNDASLLWSWADEAVLCHFGGHHHEHEDLWSSYYAPHATLTIVYKTAQAVACTPHERKVAAANFGPWTCQGWTVDEIRNEQATTSTTTILMVVTGTTLSRQLSAASAAQQQQQQWMVFTKTLLLQQNPEDPGGGYAITKDVTTLFALYE